jgi:hypothetical protein
VIIFEKQRAFRRHTARFKNDVKFTARRVNLNAAYKFKAVAPPQNFKQRFEILRCLSAT